jgi:hypothetical protein
VALVLAGGCLAAQAAGAAGATTTPLVALPGVADRLTAYGGYAVFSERSQQGTWSLMAWHAGTIAPLRVPARSIPFDAEAGPGPAGTAAVVFSKCARDPNPRAAEPTVAADVEWQRASGCRIYELSLPGGTPRLVAKISPPRGSYDATPAVWRNEIAFARYGGSGGPQLLLSAAGRVTRLGGGPTSCPAPSTIPGAPLCARGERLIRNRVAGISLSAGAAVYEWVSEVPGAFVGPLAEPEIRIDPLRDGRQTIATKLLAMSFASGACGGASSDSAEAVGGEALFLTRSFACEPGPERLTSSFELSPPVGRARSWGTGAHVLALALAVDRGALYWIGLVPSPPACAGNRPCEAPQGRPESCPAQSVCDSAQQLAGPFGCAPAEGACTLMRTTGLTLASSARTARRSRAGRLAGWSPRTARH